MRKNDMIALLQSIKGNPEIMLWNGFVCDTVPIKGIIEDILFKMTLEYYLETTRLEAACDRKDWNYQHSEDRVEYLKKMYKRVVDWEQNEYITEGDVKEGRYKTKRVFVIDSKTTGKTYFDRLGSVSY